MFLEKITCACDLLSNLSAWNRFFDAEFVPACLRKSFVRNIEVCTFYAFRDTIVYVFMLFEITYIFYEVYNPLIHCELSYTRHGWKTWRLKRNFQFTNFAQRETRAYPLHVMLSYIMQEQKNIRYVLYKLHFCKLLWRQRPCAIKSFRFRLTFGFCWFVTFVL